MKKCPTCNRQVEWQDNPYRPFCSERCKLVDFGKWIDEEYRVPEKPATAEHDGDEGLREDSDETELVN
jgi:endogenous inhibitor of DNA gyrase (YacG/DUF329 family)